jgi:hypothetical protein
VLAIFGGTLTLARARRLPRRTARFAVSAAAGALAVAAVALLGAGLVPTTLGLAHPYKTDARGLVAYLVGVRAERPDTSFVFLGSVPPGTWRTAVERAQLVPAWDDLIEHARTFPSPDPSGISPVIGLVRSAVRVNRPVVVTVYHNVADPHPAGISAALVAAIGPGSCRIVPLYGFAVVRCA